VRHVADWTAYWGRRTPTSPAIVEPHTGKTFTYAELDRRANRAAHTLAARHGVRRGDRVALLAQNRAEHFELLFACAKLGAMLAPLNWRLAPAELDVVLADADARVLYYDRELAPAVARLRGPLPSLVAFDEPDAGGERWEQLIAQASDAPAGDAEVSLEDALLLCYTSGTTGRPKGALLSHRQILFNSLSTAMAIDLTRQDSTLVFMPLFHTGGMNVLATPLLHHGGRVVVMPAFDAERVLAISAAERVSLQMGVPTIFQLLADAPRFATTDLSATRTAMCGGAPCPLPLIERYRERGILFRQGYGLTEVGPSVFSLVADDAFRKAGSVGWPNFYVQARVLDEEGREVADDASGELVLGGPAVTLGYFRNPDATAQAFRGDPQRRWFHTGDVCRRDAEGYHYIVDRKKDMFISGGENVYPAEVEQALSQIRGVAEVCVLAVADERWGEVGRAVVVREREIPDNALGAADVLRALDGKLARYKIPKSVVFAVELPRNASGKVVREEVKRRFG
jgi:fatty-acyl-CoA synthase